jgi:uncharacterized delta-60 repeat protein
MRISLHFFPRACVGLLALLLCAASASAQDPNDGATFPEVRPAVSAMVQQPDGQIVMGGSFSSVALARTRLMRIAENGQLDAGFNPGANAVVRSLALQADGKILVAGEFTNIASTARNGVARLNADGSFDASFNAGFAAGGMPRSIITYAGDKILVGGSFSVSAGGLVRTNLARLNADGSIDATFQNSAPDGEVRMVMPQADGKILVVGAFQTVAGQNRSRIARLNANGSLDTSFNANIVDTLRALAIQPDGKVLIVGTSAAVNAVDRVGVARLNPDGSVDSTFSVVANGPVDDVVLSPDGTMVIAGNFSQINNQASAKLARLRANGSLAASGNLANTAVSLIKLLQTANGKLVVGAVAQLGRDGLVQLNEDLTPNIAVFNPGADARVYALATQADGKVLMGGDFSATNGFSRNRVARLYEDGSLDLVFDPNANGRVLALALQTDDKVLIGGTFTELGQTARTNLARVNANGSIDSAFAPNPNSFVHTIVQQPDGKLLVGGNFTTIAGATRNRIARLNADGTLDGFNVNADGVVQAIAVQADGQVVLAGQFLNMNGQVRNRIARVSATGALDLSYNPNVNGTIRAIALQPDGKLMIGGTFSDSGSGAVNIARINVNGTFDPLFTAQTNAAVLSIALQADGSMLIGGDFTAVNGFGTPINRLARLLDDGAVDVGYNPNVNAGVNAIAIGKDGRALLGGVFTNIGGSNRNSLARLGALVPAQQSLRMNGSTLSWLRSGASPELSQAPTAQISSDGLSFTTLGTMQRIAGGWSLSGISLPVAQNRFVRVSAALAQGQQNGSGGRIESTGVFFVPETIFANGFE